MIGTSMLVAAQLSELGCRAILFPGSQPTGSCAVCDCLVPCQSQNTKKCNIYIFIRDIYTYIYIYIVGIRMLLEREVKQRLGDFLQRGVLNHIIRMLLEGRPCPIHILFLLRRCFNESVNHHVHGEARQVPSSCGARCAEARGLSSTPTATHSLAPPPRKQTSSSRTELSIAG